MVAKTSKPPPLPPVCLNLEPGTLRWVIPERKTIVVVVVIKEMEVMITTEGAVEAAATAEEIVEVSKSKRRSVHRVYGKHCSYRHSDFY